MFPIRDHNPSGRTPYVTWALIALNVGVFLAYWPLFDNPRALAAFFGEWGMVPARITQQGHLTGLVSSMFLHGGWLHLGGNMLFLWIFGDNLEEQMGHAGYAAFYLACGIGAALTQLLVAPLSPVPTVGASGAIAGVMGGYLLLFPRARVDVLIILVVLVYIVTLPAWMMLALWFGLQLIGSVGADAGQGGVAYAAHAGGFVIGILLTLPVFLRRGGRAFWARTAGRPPHPQAGYEFARSHIPRVRRKR
ncbi:MAG: rhomboid family intramembrane serine protease [Roseovarius sp.]